MRADRLTQRRHLQLPVLGLAALALLGCSDSTTPQTTSASSASSSTPAVSSASNPAEAAALDGYRAYWLAYLAAGDPMNPEDPALAQHATGPALETVQKAFLALKSDGKVIRGGVDLAPRVVSVDGSTATVRDCYGDATGVFD